MLEMLKPLDYKCLSLTLSVPTRNLATNERLGSSVLDRLLDLLVASKRPDHRKLTCKCLCSFRLTRSNRTLEPLKVFQKHVLKVSHNEQSTWKSNACKTHHMIWYQWRSHKGKVLSSQSKSPGEGLPKNQGMFWSPTSRLSQEVKFCLSQINVGLWTLDLSRHVGTR